MSSEEQEICIEYRKEGDKWRVLAHVGPPNQPPLDGGVIEKLPFPEPMKKED